MFITLKSIDLLPSWPCGISVYASALHDLFLLSAIVSKLGHDIRFHNQFKNLLLCSLDRYTPMAFPTCEIVHVQPSPPISSATCCISHTEGQGCEKELILNQISHLS